MKNKNLMFLSGVDTSDNKKALQYIKSNYPKHKKCLYFPSSKDGVGQECKQIKKDFKKIGVSVQTLHIEDESSVDLKKEMSKTDIIFLGGGNTFEFYKKIKSKSLKKTFLSELKDNALVIGLSAGAIMLSPTLLMACYPSKDADEYYGGLKSLRAMKLVNFEVCPHYRDSKKMKKDMGLYSALHGNPVYAIEDGEFLAVKNTGLTFSGEAVMFLNGQKVLLT